MNINEDMYGTPPDAHGTITAAQHLSCRAPQFHQTRLIWAARRGRKCPNGGSATPVVVDSATGNGEVKHGR